MQLSEGEESRAFSFDVGGRGYVLRVNSCADGFYKDRYVYRHFASAALPIPEVLDIGEFMRCEIPHRCVRRKYRIRRHSPFRLRNCWEGRSVRASSLLRQLAKGGCAARRLSWVTPGFSQSRRCKTTASAKLGLQVDSRGSAAARDISPTRARAGTPGRCRTGVRGTRLAGPGRGRPCECPFEWRLAPDASRG